MKNLFDDDLKKKLIIVLFAFILIGILYYIFSPLQTCLRFDKEPNYPWCLHNTKW